MSYSPCEWSDFPPLFIVRAQGPALKPALPHPSFCFISHWSHNAGLTLCLLTQRACESQIQQDDFAAVWLTGKCSLIWKTFSFFFFSSKWTCLFLQHGVQALYLFDIGFCDIPAGQGRTQDVHNLPCKVTHIFPSPSPSPFLPTSISKANSPSTIVRLHFNLVFTWHLYMGHAGQLSHSRGDLASKHWVPLVLNP